MIACDCDFTPKKRLLNVLASCCLALTVVLIFAGALVTSYEVGMAVPDGATTFGETLWAYNFWDQWYGIQLEHTHRLFGMAVGLVVLAYTGVTLRLDSRPWVRWLTMLALGSVIFQGLLGRWRVDNNALYGNTLATVHGIFAQFFFAQMVVLVAVTTTWWRTEYEIQHEWAKPMQLGLTALTAVVYMQIVVGAILRHKNHAFWVHATLGYLIVLLVLAFAAAVLVDRELRQRFRWSAAVLAVAVFAQVILGNAAALLTGLSFKGLRPYPSNVQAVTTAIHLLIGSAVFAFAIAAALGAWRLLRPLPPTENKNRIKTPTLTEATP